MRHHAIPRLFVTAAVFSILAAFVAPAPAAALKRAPFPDSRNLFPLSPFVAPDVSGNVNRAAGISSSPAASAPAAAGEGPGASIPPAPGPSNAALIAATILCGLLLVLVGAFFVRRWLRAEDVSR